MNRRKFISGLSLIGPGAILAAVMPEKASAANTTGSIPVQHVTVEMLYDEHIVIPSSHNWCRTKDCLDWLAEHGLENERIYQVDCNVTKGTARIYTFCLDQNRHINMDKMYAEPFEIPLKRCPPLPPE